MEVTRVRVRRVDLDKIGKWSRASCFQDKGAYAAVARWLAPRVLLDTFQQRFLTHRLR